MRRRLQPGRTLNHPGTRAGPTARRRIGLGIWSPEGEDAITSAIAG